MSDTNKIETLVHPISVCPGLPGVLYIADVQKKSILKAIPQYPVVVESHHINLSNPSFITYVAVVLYVIDDQKLYYEDIEKSSILAISKLKHAELVQQLELRNLAVPHTVPPMKKALVKWQHEHDVNEYRQRTLHLVAEVGDVNCVAGYGNHGNMDNFSTLYTTCIGCIKEFRAVSNGVKLQLNLTRSLQLNLQNPTGLTLKENNIYIADSNIETGGLVRVFWPTSDVNVLLKNNSNRCGRIYSVAIQDTDIIYTDVAKCMVKKYADGVSERITGSWPCDYPSDGCEETSCHVQQTGVCLIGNSIILTDSGCGAVKLISPLTGYIHYLQNLGDIYRCFGVHSPAMNVERAYTLLQEVAVFFRKMVEDCRTAHPLSPTRLLQGPDGVPAEKTIKTIETNVLALSEFIATIGELNPNILPNIDSKPLTSLINEHFHHRLRQIYDMPDMLQLARTFSSAVDEFLKKSTECGYLYNTSRKDSYYEQPVGLVAFNMLPKLPLPTDEKAKFKP
ncbi:unnamed protein product [Owenia fusiformis]|uniref:Uncharacterized protein n=1 Tax=Owenia fusiformis TaxID=6347 RepID=A0A8S4NNP8_OWEFU|nr:unnamed protein product [Owenia fusiformis]